MKILMAIIYAIGLILILTFSIVSAYTFSKIYDSEWVCLAQECVDFVTGDEWVKENCRPDENNEMVCSFFVPSVNQDVTMSMRNINISNMVSCKTYECSSWALVSYSNKLREVK